MSVAMVTGCGLANCGSQETDTPALRRWRALGVPVYMQVHLGSRSWPGVHRGESAATSPKSAAGGLWWGSQDEREVTCGQVRA